MKKIYILLFLLSLVFPAMAQSVYEDTGYTRDGYTPVQLNGLWGMVDSLEHLVIPTSYDYISSMNQGVCFAKKGSMWGIIDQYNDIVIPFMFENKASLMGEGVWFFVIKGRWYIFNVKDRQTNKRTLL